ncbi:MAG: phenylalanine 4-monooxygenase [Acidobacteriota bacterium]|nr:phenylalanine 4-monooxygenase [Acidobacteriota bacterium]
MLNESAAAKATEPEFTFHTRTDEKMPEFRDMQFENINQLHLDHPGANDEEYLARRNYIASLAKKFRETHIITDVDYDEREQNVWRHVAAKLEELQQRRASRLYLEAKKKLGISNDRIPQLSELNKKLGALSGFRLAPIEGLVETRGFLSWLSWRTMLCTQYIRHWSRPEYTPEPDIVHESIGHIPMFANRDFADFSQFIGHGARVCTDQQLEELGRLYWFTVEFGLIEEDGEIKAFGAGLLSSFGELEHAFGDEVERRPFDLEQVINTPYDYSDMQPILYVIPSYAYLKDVTRKYIESFRKK